MQLIRGISLSYKHAGSWKNQMKKDDADVKYIRTDRGYAEYSRAIHTSGSRVSMCLPTAA
jgi:hypothetical protein